MMDHDDRSVAGDSRAERMPLAKRYLDEGVVARYEDRRYRGGWRSLKYRLWLRVLERGLDAVCDANTVADLPCGPGFLAEIASTRFPLVIASDISPAMVRQSLSRAQVSGLVADIAHLPFADGALDCTINLRFMVHFEPGERSVFLRELARVSSRYVIVNYNHRYNIKYVLRRVRTVLGLLPARRTTRKCSRAELDAEARAAGLRISKLMREFSLIPFTTERWLVVFEKETRPAG